MQLKRFTVIVIGLIMVTGMVGKNIYKRYHPRNIDEAIIIMDKAYSNKRIYSDKYKKEIYDMTESEFMTKSSFSTGLWIRYRWGLSQGTKLSTYFNQMGIYHPRDMSDIILLCYYRHLHNQDYDLNQLIKYYQERRSKSHRLADNEVG